MKAEVAHVEAVPDNAGLQDAVLIGYLKGQASQPHSLATQRQALDDAGCRQVAQDLVGNGRHRQPELKRLVGAMQPGEVLVVPHLRCLGRSLLDVVRSLRQIADGDAGLLSLEDRIDTRTPEGRAAVGAILRLAEADQGARRERFGVGLHAASVLRGSKAGRRPKLAEAQRALVAEEVLAGRSTAAAMARHHRVSEATVSRILAAARAAADAPATTLDGATPVGGADPVVRVLPLSVLDGRLAIVGTSGSGKTYAAKGLVERLLDEGRRVCIVDPLGVWWGLRAGPEDGLSRSPWPVVVFGGAHADVMLDAGMGASLGQVVGKHALACVVDVSDLGSAAVRRTFMTAFADALHQANTAPLHLVLDEADLWAPQRAQPNGQDLLGRVEEIVRRGRVRGFVPWLITQRPAVLHKDVLSQADILLSMKLTSSQDREAVGRWIEGQTDRAEGRRILAALPQLGRGEGWVWSPADGVLDRVAFPRIRSFDSSRTPPRPGRVTPADPLMPVDLEAITAALAGVATSAVEAHADPLEASREQARELERRLRQHERELAAARTRIAEMEAKTATLQAQLNQVE